MKRPLSTVAAGLTLGLTGLLLAGPAFAGEPILLPDFTPGTTSEFGLAAMLQERTEEALSRAGHVVLLGEMVESVVGDPLDACADTPGCPTLALAKLPARFGVVVTIRRDAGQVFADVALYEQSGRDPVEKRTFEIIGGREGEFGRMVSDLVDELVKVMGPADATALIAAAKIVAAWEDGEEVPTGPTGGNRSAVAPRDPEPDPPNVDNGDDPQPDPEPEILLTPEARLQAAIDEGPYLEKHLVGVREQALESELDLRDWMFRRTPHGGRTIVEVRGGLGIGDTDRIAYVRTTVSGDGQEQWFREGPRPGQGVRGELFIGYAPSAWFDLGVLLGLQYGERVLDSGWVDGSGNTGGSVDAAQAVQFDLEPRARFYPVRMGTLKPYIGAGAQFRFFDQWRIADVDDIAYAEPPAGMVVGPVGAVGLLVDPSPMVGFFVEGAGVLHQGIRASPANPRDVAVPSNAPAEAMAENPAHYTVSIVGGVQFRL